MTPPCELLLSFLCLLDMFLVWPNLNSDILLFFIFQWYWKPWFLLKKENVFGTAKNFLSYINMMLCYISDLAFETISIWRDNLLSCSIVFELLGWFDPLACHFNGLIDIGIMKPEKSYPFKNKIADFLLYHISSVHILVRMGFNFL